MYTGNNKFEADQLDVMTFRTISRLSPGTFSTPSYTENMKGEKVFRILYLKSKSEPHVANLVDDYQKIKVVAEENKKAEVMNKWINKKIQSVFIKIDSRYTNCEFENNWLKAN
jgi:peptidyl-prolyl cis-trans isomerase SurA